MYSKSLKVVQKKCHSSVPCVKMVNPPKNIYLLTWRSVTTKKRSINMQTKVSETVKCVQKNLGLILIWYLYLIAVIEQAVNNPYNCYNIHPPTHPL